jgi:hypothetical protein
LRKKHISRIEDALTLTGDAFILDVAASVVEPDPGQLQQRPGVVRAYVNGKTIHEPVTCVIYEADALLK